MTDFEEKMLESFEEKSIIWWRYVDDIFFIWDYGEESLKVFIQQVNMFHSTIKFTAEYSKEEVNFLDVNIKLIDLFVKPMDTHQFSDPTSCHPYHCQKGIPYSQALRLNRICSDNETFGRCCNDLEKWLIERGYNEKMIRKQILSAREHSRNDLVEKEKQQMSEKKLTFNITYYPAFQNVRSIMEELHILLTPNKQHKKVFPDVPVVGFRNGKSLNDYLVRAKLFKLEESRKCEPCEKNLLGL